MPHPQISEIASLIRAIDPFSTTQDAISGIKKAQNGDAVVVVSFINAHALNLARKDNLFLSALSASDLLFRDGIGMEILINILGLDPGFNLNGTDLIPQILKLDSISTALLFGTNTPQLKRASVAINQLGIEIIGAEDGFSAPENYLRVARKKRCDLILLGMGMPKQELISARLKAELDYPCLVINGGAILDFIGGSVRRAPTLIQKLRLEWFYRLISEPRRLWRRYLIGNIVFLASIPLIISAFQQSKESKSNL